MKKSKPEQLEISKDYYKVFPTTDLFLLQQRLFLIPKVLLNHCFTSACIFFPYCACFSLPGLFKELKETNVKLDCS